MMSEFRDILFFAGKENFKAGQSKASHKENSFNGRMAGCAIAIALGAAATGLILGLSGCGGADAKASAPTSSNAPLLVISPVTVDFGDVNVGTPVFQNVSITNQGTSSAEIAQLSTSNNAFSVKAKTLPVSLPSGGSISVQIGYDPGSATDSTGQLNVNATAGTSAIVTSAIKLHGKGSNSTQPSLTELSCANLSQTGAGTDTCTVTLNAPAIHGGTAVSLVSSSSEVTIPVSVSVPSGATSASFAANISAVSTSQTVTLTATQGTVSKTATINLSGLAPPVTPTISAFSCASSSFTGAGSTTCTVSLSSSAPSGGLSVTVASNDSAVTVPASVAVASGASKAAFTANAASVSTAQTSTVSASANNSSKSFALQLNAATAALSLNASSLSFGNISVGTAVTKSVTITSSGTSAVTINSASISGTGFSVLGGSLPITLNPGQATVETVQFDPTSAGAITGQLTILSTAPTASVSLSGAGTSVTPTVSAVSCSSTSITGSLADACTVSLSGSSPTGGVSVSLSSSNSAVTVPSSVTVPATATSAAFTANAAAVSSAQSVTLTAATGSTSHAVSLQLNAATAALSLNATSVSFGDVVVNNATTQTVTLKSSGTAAVTVNSVAVTGSGFSAAAVSLPAMLNPGQTLVVTLTFDPSAVGAATGQLTISSNASTNSTATVSLSGTGDPHKVDLSWSPPSGSSDPIAGYNVYRALSGTTSYGVVDSMNTQTAYTDSTVQAGQTYNYYVTSVDSSGVESAPSNTTSVTVP
jgi:hypothetical protein